MSSGSGIKPGQVQSSGDFSALGNLALIPFEPDKPQGGVRFNYKF